MSEFLFGHYPAFPILFLYGLFVIGMILLRNEDDGDLGEL
jgi:hypothetical protein